MRQRINAMMAALAVLLILSGCGGGEEAASDPTPTPEPTAAAAPMTLGDVVWASALDEDTGEPVDEVQVFTTVSPSVVAAVPVSNVPAGTEFTAEWTIDGLEVPEATMNVTVEEDMTTAWVAFEFVRAEDRYFPLGELEVVITASTGESVTGAVQIELP